MLTDSDPPTPSNPSAIRCVISAKLALAATDWASAKRRSRANQGEVVGGISAE